MKGQKDVMKSLLEDIQAWKREKAHCPTCGSLRVHMLHEFRLTQDAPFAPQRTVCRGCGWVGPIKAIVWQERP